MTLDWPANWPRTPPEKRVDSRFGRLQTTQRETYSFRSKKHLPFTDAYQRVVSETTRADASQLVVEHDGEYTVRGDPLVGKREPDDPGVIVRWTRAGKQYALPCDKYRTRAENLGAIAATIEAMRIIERHGVLSTEQSYRAAEALPAGNVHHVVLNVGANATEEEIEAAFRKLARAKHPDAGGSMEEFIALQEAREAMLAKARRK